MQIEVNPGEQGLIRVFAVNRPATELTAALRDVAKHHLATQLLGHPLPEDGAELFPVRDLSGIGLSGYLSQGYAVPQDQLKASRAKLDALDGYVMLVFSSAFEGQAVTLSPGPDLTLIGTFGETQPDMSTLPLESEAAQPYSGTPSPTRATPPQGRAGGSLMVVGLIVLVALVLWLVLG